MAPQLTEAKVHKTEAKYDGCKADVWSMGVLLAVMMLGKFPFDDATGAMADTMRMVSRNWAGRLRAVTTLGPAAAQRTGSGKRACPHRSLGGFVRIGSCLTRNPLLHHAAPPQVYQQQHMYACWRDNPALRDHVPLLSPEAVDVLDRCFERDEDARWAAGRAGWCRGVGLQGGSARRGRGCCCNNAGY